MKQNLLNKLWLRVSMIVAIMTTALSGTVWAETITFADLGLENGVQYTDPFDGGGFTVTFAGGANDGKYYTTGSGIRVYGGGTMTIASKSTTKISTIEITYDGNNKPTSNDIVNVGTYNYTTGTWTGEATSVVFTRPSGSGHWRVKSVAVTYASASVVATPVIGGNVSFLTSTEVSISCGTSGATIKYSTNDGSTWIDYTEPFTLTATTTVKAKATKSGMTDSEVASKTFTKATVMTVAEAIAATPATGTSSAVFIQGVVSAFFKTSIVDDGNNYRYYISDDGTTTNQLLVYKGAGLNQVTFTNADDLLVGDEVIVYGSLTTFNNAAEVAAGNYLVSFNRPAAPVVPVINANATLSLAYDATSGEIAYTVENPVEGTSLIATSSETWLTIGTISETSVAFTCTANEDVEDRTATITLTYGEVTKNVTVTQAAYEAPVADYATLPFSYDGSGATVLANEVDGLTGGGLGSYNTNQKIKFDGTGDYLILKINERPGVLTFDIKGNTFSGGTFTVQTSEDGTTYTDLKTYTELGDTQNESFNNLGENVRYIKWIYTNKSSGNVALGNINLAAYSTAPVINAEDVSIASDATSGEIAYTITNPASGVTLNATTDADWVSGITVTAEKVTFTTTANEGGERTATFTLTYTGAEDKEVTVTQSAYVTPITGDKYVKVTSTADLTDGQYLIVYEEGSVAFDGGLETLDAVGNTIEVTISNNEIAATSATTAAEFTIDVTAGTIQSASGMYIGQTSDANGLASSAETTYANEISITEGNADIVSADAYLRYNSASNQTRFRYYKSSSYTGQKAIQLYKKVEEVPTSQTVTVSAAGYATFVTEAHLEIPADVEVFAIQTHDSYATLLPVTGNIPAGEAVLVKADAGEYSFAYAQEADPIAVNELVGATEDVVADGTQYILANGGEGIGFYKATTGSTIKAGKAYLVVPAGIKGFYGFDEDDATGISDLNANVNANEAIYNLAGQRIQKMQRGINIVGGKKVLK